MKQGGVLQSDGNFFLAWSISTEIGLYLMFAVGIVLLSRLKRGTFIALVGMIVYSAALVVSTAYDGIFEWIASTHVLDAGEPADAAHLRKWFFYVSPYYRICEFSVGAAAAYTVIKRRQWVSDQRSLLSSGVIIGLLAIIPLHFVVYAGDITWAPTLIVFRLTLALIFAGVMVSAANKDGAVNRFLSHTSLVTIGTCSLSLYLFHPFAARMIIATAGDATFSTDLLPKFIRIFGISMALAIVLAYGMYQLVELPAQRFLRRFSLARGGAVAGPVAR